jgi:hypothetical protein
MALPRRTTGRISGHRASREIGDERGLAGPADPDLRLCSPGCVPAAARAAACVPGGAARDGSVGGVSLLLRCTRGDGVDGERVVQTWRRIHLAKRAVASQRSRLPGSRRDRSPSYSDRVAHVLSPGQLGRLRPPRDVPPADRRSRRSFVAGEGCQVARNHEGGSGILADVAGPSSGDDVVLVVRGLHPRSS